MKNKLINIYLSLLIITILVSGCKKADTTIPVLTLKGGSVVNSSLNSPFVDPGYTATDNKDGDITTKVTSTWTPAFNKDLTGQYKISYKVSDAAGNIDTASRIVNVVNDADFLSGTFSCNGNCDNTGGLTFNSNITTFSNVNNSLNISNFGGFNGSIINGTYNLSDNTISIPSGQSLGGSSTLVSASATVTHHSSPTSISINFSWSDGSNSDNCTSTYTK